MKKILTALSLLIILFMLGTAVFADGGSLALKCEDAKSSFEKDSTFTVTVSSTGSPAYTTGIVDVVFDEEMFELTNIAFNNDLAPNNATHLKEDEEHAISATEYFAGSSEGKPVLSDKNTFTVSFGDDLKTENYTEAGVLFTLTFKVKKDAEADSYPIALKEVADLPDSFLDANMDPVTVSLADGSVSKAASGTFSAGGNVESFAAETDPVTIRLIPKGSSTAAKEIEVTGNKAQYSITGIEAGTYTVEVSKSKHVTRTYEVDATNGNVTMDLKILLYGDVTQDGIADGIDATQINRFYTGKPSVFTQAEGEFKDYLEKVADVSGDKSVDGIDATQINRHYTGKPSVFDTIS